MSESGGGRPGLPVPGSRYGLRGRKARLNTPALTMRSGSSAARRAVQKTSVSRGYKYKCISNLCYKTQRRCCPSLGAARVVTVSATRTILRIFTTEVTLGHEIESVIGHGDLSEPGYRGVTRSDRKRD